MKPIDADMISHTNAICASLAHKEWRGFYMKGSVYPDAKSCACGSIKFVKESFRGMDFWKCQSCGADPKFFRIRRYLPTADGRGETKDIRYDHAKRRLVSIQQAHAMMTYLDSMISTRKFDPMEYSAKEGRKILEFSHFVDNIYLPHYEEKLKNGDYKPSSMAAKKQYLRNHLKPHFGSTSIKNIDDDAVESLYQELKCSARMKDLIAQELKALLRFAKRKKYIKEVPEFRKQRRAKLKDPEKFLTKEEQDQVIVLVEDLRYRAMIKLLSCTGLRPSEVRALRWSDWDFKKGTLWIQRHVTYRSIVVPGRKSNDDFHTVTISQRMLSAIEELARPLDKDQYMFKGDTQEIVSEHCLSRAWARAIKLAGLQYVDLYRGTKSSLLSQKLREGHSVSEIAVATGLSEEVVKRYAQHNSNSLRQTQARVLEG